MPGLVSLLPLRGRFLVCYRDMIQTQKHQSDDFAEGGGV
ncbi:hypothetical protein SynBMKMC1_03013 [Synechococcus sp. BMK-MC-1]|nr:hypothetical protein SynBMKMC1_03013 [Synechococcus sp. BMK-MC-1]